MMIYDSLALIAFGSGPLTGHYADIVGVPFDVSYIKGVFIVSKATAIASNTVLLVGQCP